MSMESPEFDKGHQGAKRASWKKNHFRDLALKVCEEHPKADVEELADLFLKELENFPDYMESIAVYIMANVRASLDPGKSRHPGRPGKADDAIFEKVTNQVAARVLMNLRMPTGKTLGESTGAECTRAGGWLKAVGTRVGPRGIVSKKLSEKDLVEILKKT